MFSPMPEAVHEIAELPRRGPRRGHRDVDLRVRCAELLQEIARADDGLGVTRGVDADRAELAVRGFHRMADAAPVSYVSISIVVGTPSKVFWYAAKKSRSVSARGFPGRSAAWIAK